MSLKVNRNGNFQVGNTASGGSPASGTIEISENGVYDVRTFAEADVQTPVPSGKINITENGTDIDVSDYALADVDVERGVSIDEDYTISEGVLTAVTTELDGDVVANIPDGVTTIGNTAFMDNKIITNVVMPDSVLTVNNGTIAGNPIGAFAGCSNLNNIVLSTNLEKIANSMFADCKKLISLNLPNGVNEIGTYAFYRCTGLTTVNIPNSVTVIGYYAFSGCTNLTSFIVPDSVTSIGNNAFSGCTSLTDIYYTGTQAEWEAISGIADAGIPETTTIHYEYTPS